MYKIIKNCSYVLGPKVNLKSPTSIIKVSLYNGDSEIYRNYFKSIKYEKNMVYLRCLKYGLNINSDYIIKIVNNENNENSILKLEIRKNIGNLSLLCFDTENDTKNDTENDTENSNYMCLIERII